MPAPLLADDVPLVLAGDYNVCPEDVDYAQGVLGSDDALVRPATRERYWKMIWSGLTDGLRALTPTGRFIRSGITRPGAGSAIAGCASIMRCCRLPWPSGCVRPSRSGVSGGRIRLLIMCRW